MSKFQQKAEAQTKQIIGQMLGDELLVEEGKEQQRGKRRSRDRSRVATTRAAMTKASSATNADRSSRGTRSVPSA
jgi:hypothetical protein